MANEKNQPIGQEVIAEAMLRNEKKRLKATNIDDDRSTPGENSKATGTSDKQPAATNSKKMESPKSTPEKKTKGVVGAKGVKLQPVQAKLKPTLYATHQQTILSVNNITDSNITSADIMRASVHILSKMKAEKILEAIKETAI